MTLAWYRRLGIEHGEAIGTDLIGMNRAIMGIKATTWDAYQLLHQGTEAFAVIERNGIRVDVAYLDFAIEGLASRIKKTESKLRGGKVWQEWRKVFGEKASLGSDVQLGKMLFEVMGLSNFGKTPTERWRTDEAVLTKINHPFVKRLLKFKKLKHLKGTSLEGLRREVVDGFLHTDLNLHTVRSFRSSSGGSEEVKSYNTQNIPRRDDDAAEIVRKALIPRPGCVLIENDFSAHEFKIAANVWRDRLMMEYAADKTKDIHRDMAAKMFLISKDQAKEKSVRYVGKNGFVFPRLYGSYHKQIAKVVWDTIDELTVDGIPLKEHLASKGLSRLGDCNPQRDAEPGTFEHHVKKVEAEFLSDFHVFAERCEQVWQEYRQTGRFDLITGFIIEGLYKRNAVLNIKVQGPAFHCLLWTIIQLVLKELKKRKMKAKVVNQIHDCVIADVPEREIQDYLWLVKEVVEIKLPKAWDWLVVPLEIEAEVANGNWFNKESWIEREGKWIPK